MLTSIKSEIPINEFAIIKDTETNVVVYAGTFVECDEMAGSMNYRYFTTAYVAERWNH